MELRDKWLTGLVKSFSLVDTTLTNQGFKRCGKPECATYQLSIQDSATQSAYYLTIPTTLESLGDDQMVLRIGKPFLKKQSFMKKLKPTMSIPNSIRSAVDSKLAEVADYLHSHH